MDDDALICRGNSMYPVLRSLDVVYVSPYGGRAVVPGDVVVFPSPEDGQLVVHRVIGVGRGGLRTRGDKNPEADRWLVRLEDVRGQAVRVLRGGKLRRIRGGFLGRWIGRVFHGVCIVTNALSRTLYPAYDAAARSGVLAGLVPGRLKPRVVALTRPEGIEQQLLLGRKVIGRMPAGYSRWIISPPYRLVVDERSLPAREGGRR